MLFVSPPEVVVHLVAPFQSHLGCQNMVVSAFSMKNHSWNLEVLMPEDRLYFKQRNKAEKLSAERISRMFFVSSLNSVSSSHVQHDTYAFSLHIQFASFLKRRSPKTCFYRCFLSRVLAQSIYAGLGHTQAHTHIYIYIYRSECSFWYCLPLCTSFSTICYRYQWCCSSVANIISIG